MMARAYVNGELTTEAEMKAAIIKKIKMNQPLSYVHPGAKVAKTVVLEPFSTIDNNVEIGGYMDWI